MEVRKKGNILNVKYGWDIWLVIFNTEFEIQILDLGERLKLVIWISVSAI